MECGPVVKPFVAQAAMPLFTGIGVVQPGIELPFSATKLTLPVADRPSRAVTCAMMVMAWPRTADLSGDDVN